MKSAYLLILFTLILPLPGNAGTGRVPDFQSLLTKTGFIIYKTSENHDATSSPVDLTYQNQYAELLRNLFWISAEYGLADAWSAELRSGYLTSSLDSASNETTFLSNSGLDDTFIALKWAIRPLTPFVTFETKLKIPTAASTIAANDEVVLGDGNFDMWFRFYTGTDEGRLRFFLSPALVVRFGGYSMAADLDVAMEFHFPKGFVRCHGNFFFSFEDPQLFDSSPDVHDAPGSGNSYALLAGGPIGFSLGGALGLNIYKDILLEVNLDHSIMGNKYPVFFQFGISLAIGFNFHSPSEKTHIKEVPFDFDYEKFDKQPK